MKKVESILAAVYGCIYAEKNEAKRITIGVSLELALVAFVFYFSTVPHEFGPLQSGLFCFAFYMGLFLIPDSAKKADKLIYEAGIEMAKFMTFFMAGLIIQLVLSGENTPLGKNVLYLLFFVALVYGFAYVIKIFILVYRGIKTMINLLVKKAKTIDGIEAGVSKWESLLKNIASIAATLLLIAEAGKKIVELF